MQLVYIVFRKSMQVCTLAIHPSLCQLIQHLDTIDEFYAYKCAFRLDPSSLLLSRYLG